MSQTNIHTLGFPRIGAHRELKKALESYWRGDSDGAALEACGRELRARHWAEQRDAGLDWVTVGDFAFYDQILNHIQLFGCAPTRFAFGPEQDELTRYFQLARGVVPPVKGDGAGCCGALNRDGQPALEMTKWFDTNYHYLVPEYHPDTCFSLHSERLLAEVAEAKALGHNVKVVLVGPLTLLWLGKEKQADFDRLSLLPQLLAQYRRLLPRLADAGVNLVQLDEPILSLDLAERWQHALVPAYNQLASGPVPLLVANYFGPLAANLEIACALPVAGLHVDGVRAADELELVARQLPRERVLSVGIVDGRNIWRTDLAAALARLTKLRELRGGALWLAPSCSLLHVPYSLSLEMELDPEVLPWLAFAREKLDELAVLREALSNGPQRVSDALAANSAAMAARRSSPRVQRAEVQARLQALPASADQRPLPLRQRLALQRQQLQLPLLPTTTIGSFPQTAEIRTARAAWRRGELTIAEYNQLMAREISHAVERQLSLGLDVLVHGEAERNDMVEYFGEQLQGYLFTANGWVQSYGSRCVKPPIIYGDIARPQAMTVEWARYAQSLTSKPVKGMLTGPITMLQWSFVRDDQSRATTALQLALAIRDEVVDLEQAGIAIIQIDEPALREGLPLRKSQWQHYLDWAGRAFRVAASGVGNSTQIHTHMCYSEFNDILPAIAALDADVITIETSRSQMELLTGFGEFAYPGEIGPGVYDIHSPRIPGVAEMVALLKKALEVLPVERLWVNPDCGLKTRNWAETEAALANMLSAAHQLRLTVNAGVAETVVS